MKPAAPVPSSDKGWRLVLRALRYRNFRLFITGQGISLIGTWMQRIALSWLIYRLTGSAALLGIVGFASQIPAFIISPFAGVLVDRWNLYRILVVTQTLSMIQALILAFLVMGDYLTAANALWPIIILSGFIGLINAFDIPARQSLVVHMVDKREDVGNAIALNSAMFNAARLLGPSIAGVLVAVVGEGMCFLINGLSYIAVIIALLMMQIAPRDPNAERPNVLQEFKDGFMYCFGFSPIRSILLLLAVVSLAGMPYQVLMPVFAKDVLHGNAQTLGFLMAVAGIGALVGATYLASRKSVIGLGRLIAAAPAFFGLGLMAFARSEYLYLSLALMLITGFSMMVQMASSNTLLQTVVDDDKRGRVMSFYAMSFMGTAPFGSLMAGALADRFGAPYTLWLSGIACIIGSILFSLQYRSFRRNIRPIYHRLGILRDMATAIQETNEPIVDPEMLADVAAPEAPPAEPPAQGLVTR